MNYQQLVSSFREQVEHVWPTPSVVDSVRYTNQELGELDSALMKVGFSDNENYVRSNDGNGMSDVLLELGQALMMLITLANELQVSTDRCLRLALIDRLRLLHKRGLIDADQMEHIWYKIEGDKNETLEATETGN